MITNATGEEGVFSTKALGLRGCFCPPGVWDIGFAGHGIRRSLCARSFGLPSFELAVYWRSDLSLPFEELALSIWMPLRSQGYPDVSH